MRLSHRSPALLIGLIVALTGCNEGLPGTPVDQGAADLTARPGGDLHSVGDAGMPDLLGSAADLDMAVELGVAGDGPQVDMVSGPDAPGLPDLFVLPPDLRSAGDLGGVGASCSSACDCTPGLGCFNGQCQSAIIDVYCCGSATCPSWRPCQFPNQQWGVCNFLSDGGSPQDLGLGINRDAWLSGDAGLDYCPLINCSMVGASLCVNLGCSTCAGNGTCAR